MICQRCLRRRINASLATAQQLELPVAVEGAAKAESRQYYKFHVEAGQRLSVEVLARRFGSPLDPFVRLLDDRGQELALQRRRRSHRSR